MSSPTDKWVDASVQACGAHIQHLGSQIRRNKCIGVLKDAKGCLNNSVYFNSLTSRALKHGSIMLILKFALFLSSYIHF
jgi:hypothetical protein